MSAQTIEGSVISRTLVYDVPDADGLNRQATGILEFAKSVEVTDQATYEMWSGELEDIQERLARHEIRREKITKPLYQAWKAANELFNGPKLVLEAARDVIKRGLSNYYLEQQDIARRARDEAERQRREAETIARQEAERLRQEALAKQQEATRAAQELVAAGNAQAADDLVTQACNETHQALQTADAMAASAAAVTVYAPAVELPKASGVSMRTEVDTEIEDERKLLRFIADHGEYAYLIEFRQGEIKKLAAKQGVANFVLAQHGVRATERPLPVVKGKRRG
jgi:hypothetical protein